MRPAIIAIWEYMGDLLVSLVLGADMLGICWPTKWVHMYTINLKETLFLSSDSSFSCEGIFHKYNMHLKQIDGMVGNAQHWAYMWAAVVINKTMKNSQ
jgi:hypothetical protein